MLAFFGAFCIGFTLFLLFYLLYPKLTKINSPIFEVIGEWKIKVNKCDERPESFCKIYFSGDKIIYTGYGISYDGFLATEWTSKDVHYDADIHELSFTADAIERDTGKRIRNYGYIRFHKNAKKKCENGSGYFVDLSDELQHYSMQLTKMESGEFDKKSKRNFRKYKTKAINRR